MPFTFAHPAIVLPFGRFPKQCLSPTGLVIGSMVPDLEYFIRMRISSIYSHTIPGLFWFDIPLGLLIVFIYNGLVKAPLIAHLPQWLNQRLSSFSGHPRYHAKYIAILAISVLLGAASHLLWDSFTHTGGYFVQYIDILDSIIVIKDHRVYVYKILQHSSTALGFIVIFCAIWFLPHVSSKSSSSGLLKYWGIVAVTTFTVLLVRYFTGLSTSAYGDWIVSSISALLSGVIIASLLTKHSPAPTVPHP